MTILFVIVADQGGAHEQDSCYSIWTTHALAEAEIIRLEAADVAAGNYSGTWHIVEIYLNHSSNHAIEWKWQNEINS